MAGIFNSLASGPGSLMGLLYGSVPPPQQQQAPQASPQQPAPPVLPPMYQTPELMYDKTSAGLHNLANGFGSGTLLGGLAGLYDSGLGFSTGMRTDPAGAQMQVLGAAVQSLPANMPLAQKLALIQNQKLQEQRYGLQSLGSYKTPGGYEGQIVNNAGIVAPVFPTANGQPPADLAVRSVKPGERLVDVSRPQASNQQGSTVFSNGDGVLSPQSVALQGDRAMRGDFSVFSSNRGELGQLNNNAILNYMASKGATADQLAMAKSSFENQQASTKAFGTGKQGDAVRSFSVALDHADLFKSLSQAMGNGDVRGLNAIKNIWQKEFNGSPLPTNLDAAKQILSAEIAKAVQGADVAQGDREHLQDALNSANSWQQLSGVIDNVYTPLMAGQIKGLRRQFLANTKQPSSAFDGLLSDRAFSLVHGFPAKAAALLRTNPKYRDQFDAKYGKGAAADILGQ